MPCTKQSIKFDIGFWLGVFHAVRRKGNGFFGSLFWTLALWKNNLK